MANDPDGHDVDAFLAAHCRVDIPSSFAPGEMIGQWRVAAFLGRGGSGEVYRVVADALGSAAALKICARVPGRDASRDDMVLARFRREMKLLAENRHPSFPRFMGFGEHDGRPWYAMELLEHRPLPTLEREIAGFLIAVASGVRHLHSLGLVHRDIKPGNILWRGESPVLIDLGLVKDATAMRGHAGDTLSIVDGMAVAVGTPRYAAPEQISGDDVSPATDVYALGMLANDCFSGNPGNSWRHIIQRSTTAVPSQRYATIDEFIKAIENRNLRRTIAILAATSALVVLSALAAFFHLQSKSAEKEERRIRLEHDKSAGEKAAEEAEKRIREEHDEMQEWLMKDVY